MAAFGADLAADPTQGGLNAAHAKYMAATPGPRSRERHIWEQGMQGAAMHANPMRTPAAPAQTPQQPAPPQGFRAGVEHAVGGVVDAVRDVGNMAAKKGPYTPGPAAAPAAAPTAPAAAPAAPAAAAAGLLPPRERLKPSRCYISILILSVAEG
jgi:protein TonB